MSLISRAALVAALFLCTAFAPALAQSLWTDVDDAPVSALAQRVTVPQTYRLVRLDVPQMGAALGASPVAARPGSIANGALLSLPLPEGGMMTVSVVESSIMAPELQAKFPEIRTYRVQGVGAVHGRLSLTPEGFRGMVFAPGGTIYIDPYARGEKEHYVVYRASDLVVDAALRGRIDDKVEGVQPMVTATRAKRAHGETLRTYRLAVAATGEYTSFHGGTVAGGMAAITNTVNRVAGIYERDLSVSFQIVANNDLLVYTNSATDPYSNTSGDLNANRTNINAVIGLENYDVGHLVGTGGGGVAQLGVICSANKARGLTGSSQPVGDAFDVDYVAHEIGHQFAGNHTFNGDSGNCAGGNRNASTAYEPGSGSTIQAYAGICGNDNLQNNSDPYFHGISLDEMTAHVTTGSGGTCGTTTATGNTIPVVTVPGNYTIPVGTPFMLTGSATDDTPASLTYTWEEFDLGPQADVNAGTIPLFRSFEPTASPTRTFPQMGRLLAGQAPVIGETLPTLSQTLNFRLTARDNAPGAGAINDASLQLITVNTAGPFAVTFANASGQTYGGPTNITWDVAGTNLPPVSATTVDILFSADNGATFDTVLASGAANDGAELVTLPNLSTSQGRILIRAVGNVFFNVNAQPFTVEPAGDPAQISVSPAAVSASVASGGSGTSGVTVANVAASGAASLTYQASIQNQSAFGPRPVQAPEAAVAVSDRPKGDKSDDGTGTTSFAGDGPDTFGYEWKDSNEAGGPAVSFQSIAGSGSALAWTATSATYAAADEGYADVALPFTFPFYGTDRSTVRVYTNGFLTFTSLVGDTFTNGTIPASATPNAVIAPFWDDLDLSSAGAGTVYTGTLPDGRFVVQFDGVTRYGSSSTVTFQVLLSASGAIEFQYGALAGTLTSATVGIENDGGDDGLQIVRNAAYLASNTAVRFEAPSTWISVAPASGTVSPGASNTLTLSFDAADLPDGTYTADLVVTSNDPTAPSTIIPVSLTVGATTPSGPIVVTSPTAGATLSAGATVDITWSPGSVDPGTEIDVTLKRPGQRNQRLVSDIPNSGSYTWTIPTDQEDAEDYYIFLVYDDPVDGRQKPRSGTFSIGGSVPNPDPITISSPADGDIIAAGGTLDIVWDQGDVPASTDVKIILKRTGERNQTITSRTTNSGAFSWTVPADQPLATNYYVFFVYEDPSAGRLKPKSGTFEIAASTQALTASNSLVEEAVFALAPVAPNPSRGRAEVRFSLSEEGAATVSVLDVRGREIARLADGVYARGVHTAAWDASGVAPGVYVVRLNSAEGTLVQRITIAR